jgi:hypothetical protein
MLRGCLVWVHSPLGSFIRLMNAPLRLAGDTLIDDFLFRMDRVCRLLGYVPNAHRDPISINQNSNKKSPVVKPENSRFTYRFHSVVTRKLTTSEESLKPFS